MINNLMYALYIILGIAPFSFVRIYPFYNKMRIKPKYYWMIFSAILMVELLWFIIIEEYRSVLFINNNELLRLVFYFVYLLLSIIVIKEELCKHLIVWAICMIFSSTLTSLTFWIHIMFPSRIPFFIKNITMILLLPMFTWLIFNFINNRIMPLINQSNKKVNSLICALLILIFIMALITARELPYNAVRPFAVFSVRVVACTITIIVCYIFSEIIKEQNEKFTIMEENKQKEKILEVSTEQFIALSDKIEETRRARHDLKFHMSAIKAFADKRDYESLLEYIENDNLLPSNKILTFCNHPTLNILFSYYRDIAETNYIDFKVVADVAPEIFLNSSEIWVLLGNLLENAIEATRRMSERNRVIRVKMDANNISLALTVDNPFSKKSLNQSGKNFISTKKGGGVGLQSISFLAEKYNGIATFEVENGWFLSAVTMYNK